ncbi:MAG: hypothetical protein AAFY98_08675 [Verrucomicrobiota bacterium]
MTKGAMIMMTLYGLRLLSVQATASIPVTVDVIEGSGATRLPSFASQVAAICNEEMLKAGEDLIEIDLQIHHAPADQVLPDFLTYPRNLQISGDQIRLQIIIDAPWEDHRQALVRTIASGFIQCLIWKDGNEAELAALPEPPLWFSEGLTQWCDLKIPKFGNESLYLPAIQYGEANPRAELYRQIIWKAVRSKHLPSLDEIQEWKDLSEFAIEQTWQQAMCFWLFQSIAGKRITRESLLNWCQTLNTIAPDPFWQDTSRQESWWRAMAKKSEIAPEYLLRWEQSVAKLSELKQFEYYSSQDKETKLIQLDQLPKETEERKALQKALVEHLQKIEETRVRLHPLWQKYTVILNDSLYHWLQGDWERYDRAREEMEFQMQLMNVVYERLNDQLDWTTVNQQFSGLPNQYRSFSEISRELLKERSRVKRELVRRAEM